MSKLFSEVYGCYFGIILRILNRAKCGASRKDIEKIVNEYGFSETAFHLLPELIDGGGGDGGRGGRADGRADDGRGDVNTDVNNVGSGIDSGEWNLLEQRGELYYSRFVNDLKRPLTKLELSYLSALLKDPRLKLFLADEKYDNLCTALNGITPAFEPSDFISADKHLDGDPYSDPNYIFNFREILKAVKNNYPVTIAYDSEKTGRTMRTYHPFKLSYSELNDKFRLLCGVYNSKTKKLSKAVLNLGKIVSVKPSDLPHRIPTEDLCKLFIQPNENPPIVLEISKERNTLERFLLQFASFDRYTEYDCERDIYICQIAYDIADETELLIRILGFGPTVKVIAPQSFLKQVKERIAKQMQLTRWQ